MSSFARKVKRNSIKKLLKNNKVNRNNVPLSKYRFKTKNEILMEQANKITDDIQNHLIK